MDRMRTICVPKDEKAAYDYDHGQEKPEQMEKLILGHAEFILLYKADVFGRINNVCNSFIDDYEDETIDFLKADDAVKVVNDLSQENQENKELVELLGKIKEMFLLAKQYKTLVGFDF